MILFVFEQFDQQIAAAIVFVLRGDLHGSSMVGVPSRNRTRSMSTSACFISSMDCFLM
jgi:hypothetical protein